MNHIDAAHFTACFRAWHEPLRRLGTLLATDEGNQLSETADGLVLWIQRDLQRSGRDANSTTAADDHSRQAPLSPRTVEGLRLLAALAHHDVGLWREQLKQIWTDPPLHEWIDSKLTDATSTGVDTPLLLGISCAVPVYRSFAHMAGGVSDWSEASASFHDILRLISCGDIVGSSCRLPIRLDFGHGLASGYMAYEAMLEEVVGFVESQQGRSDDARIYFEIVEVVNLPTDGVGLEQRAFKVLMELHTLGIHLDEFPSIDITPSKDQIKSITTILQTLLGHPRVKSVSINNMYESSAVATAVLSMVHFNPSIRAIRFRMRGPSDGPGEQLESNKIWRLFTRAVFSRHVSEQIDYLEMCLPPSFREDFEIIHRVLLEEERDSSKNIFRDVDGDSIIARRFHLSSPAADFVCTEPESVFESVAPLDVRVLSRFSAPDGSEWLSVLLPARGEAWVQAHDVTARATVPATGIQPRPSRPTFFEIKLFILTDRTLQYTASLLELIGQSTRKLSILMDPKDNDASLSTDDFGFDEGVPESSRESTWTRQVLSACPKLKDFEFAYPSFLLFQPFLDCASAGISRLRRFSATCVFGEDHEDLRRFFEALSDPCHLLSAHLRELHLDLRICDADLDAFLPLMTEMLQKNHSLSKITFSFQLRFNLQYLRPSIEKAFEVSRDGVGLWVCTNAVSTQNKLAFLSVMQARGPRTRLPELDHSVVATIFHFAATGAIRKVCIEFGSVFYY